MSVTIHEGSALDVLRTLPSTSVQMCVTSPPYFNLRAYSTNPQVWGGDPEHGHVFGGEGKSGSRLRNGHGSASLEGSSQGGGTTLHPSTGAFCPCGAWRGELGSEPTPALFIEHLLLIFDEVGRVMRPDATLWVNLGDSYSGSGKGPTGKNGIGDQGQRQGFVNGRGKTTSLNWSDDPSHANSQQRSPGADGIPAKNLLLIPERFAIGMQERGWIVRSRIAWCKTSAMPESVRDRPTQAWEHIWMFAKSRTYFFDQDAVRGLGSPKGPSRVVQRSHFIDQRLILGHDFGFGSPPATRPRPPSGVDDAGGTTSRGANLRNYWLLGPEPSSLEHYAGFPTELPKRCILAGSRPGDTVLDPFLGSGTTALVADRLGRDAIGIELNSDYVRMAKKRLENDAPMVSEPVEVVPAAEQGSLF